MEQKRGDLQYFKLRSGKKALLRGQRLYGLSVSPQISLFSEFMELDVPSHLARELNRIIVDTVKLTAAPTVTGRYAESWRDKNFRNNDLILRITRILAK